MSGARTGLFAAAAACTSIALAALPADAGRQLENLGRGVVGVRQADGNVYVGWRLLATDPADVALSVCRTVGEATATTSWSST